MKLITWNLAGRTSRIDRQVDALASRAPDIVALQEVTERGSPTLRACLNQCGLTHIVDGFELAPSSECPRRYRQMVASRYDISPILEPVAIPFQEALLVAEIDTPFGPIDLFNCHVPPGSPHGWSKIETFEGVFSHLAHHATRPRILCGDFNSPQAEMPDGTVITWGQHIRQDGSVRIRRRIRGGDAARWDTAERSVLQGLREYDLPDVYRELHGFDRSTFSLRLMHKGRATDRRFDHVFAAPSLNPIDCRYLHEFRSGGLSDHAGLEVEFQPKIHFADSQ